MGGLPDLDLSFHFSPLCPLWDFPDFCRDFPICPGIFPICPFPLSLPVSFMKSTYEEQSRKCPRHNLDLSRKKWETSRFGSPRFLLSLNSGGSSEEGGFCVVQRSLTEMTVPVRFRFLTVSTVLVRSGFLEKRFQRFRFLTYNLALSQGSARTPTIKTANGCS